MGFFIDKILNYFILNKPIKPLSLCINGDFIAKTLFVHFSFWKEF